MAEEKKNPVEQQKTADTAKTLKTPTRLSTAKNSPKTNLTRLQADTIEVMRFVVDYNYSECSMRLIGDTETDKILKIFGRINDRPAFFL
ncbi:MAG: hypothetical protein IJP68_05000 [Selenomonadaceae bacterium]|nr:hypothetical protein [Selenomonadaceae bacterium]